MTPSLGRNIAGERVRKGLHQKDLASLSGITQAQISRIEVGRAVPRADSLSRIANALGVGIDHLMPERRHASDLATAAA